MPLAWLLWRLRLKSSVRKASIQLISNSWKSSSPVLALLLGAGVQATIQSNCFQATKSNIYFGDALLDNSTFLYLSSAPLWYLFHSTCYYVKQLPSGLAWLLSCCTEKKSCLLKLLQWSSAFLQFSSSALKLKRIRTLKWRTMRIPIFSLAWCSPL